jgi:hypothetical protein
METKNNLVYNGHKVRSVLCYPLIGIGHISGTYSMRGKMKNSFENVAGKLKGEGHVSDLGIGQHWRIILK